MTQKPRPQYWVLRFRTVELELGPKVWIAALLALILVGLGVLVSGWAGVAVGISGAIGGCLGALLQTQPLAEDLRPRAFAAVAELHGIAQSVQDSATVLAQLGALPANQRIQLGLLTVGEDLEAARIQVYQAIVQWEGIAPGVIGEVQEHQTSGLRAFQRFQERTNNE